jgi:hypothetical protein
MQGTDSSKYRQTDDPQAEDAFRLRLPEDAAREAEPEVHVIRKGVICATDSRGFATPMNRSITEIVVDASEGFIPLWAKNTTLRWRFQQRSMSIFRNPTAAKAAIRRLMGEAIVAWGDARPVKFAERNDLWDFEIVVRPADQCTTQGCVLASAFFPDAGRHELRIYPKMFEQTREEQVETLVHEIGHVFGLRHFFAKIREADWPSHVFGTHSPFSIMNYGAQSQLTPQDKSDLKSLYQLAWSGQLTNINGTPIRLLKPFSAIGSVPDNLVTVTPVLSAVTSA